MKELLNLIYSIILLAALGSIMIIPIIFASIWHWKKLPLSKILETLGEVVDLVTKVSNSKIQF